MLEQLQPYILEIVATVLTAVASFIGMKIKKIYEEKVNTETKEKVVKTVCNAVEQLYQDLSGNEKLIKAQGYIIEQLNEKGITITELEMKMLIESTINSFNKSIKGDEK